MMPEGPCPPDPCIEPDNPLWRFATALWSQAGAPAAALALQDRGWSVTRLIVAGYLAHGGWRWSGAEPEEIRAWRHDVTTALRSLRKALPKSRRDLAALRASTAQAELEAERIELGWWHQWLEQNPPDVIQRDSTGTALLAANLIAAGQQTPEPCPDCLADFALILAPASTRKALAGALSGASAGRDMPGRP